MADAPNGPGGVPDAGAGATKKARPIKELPTDRIKAEKKYEIILAYASCSGPDGNQPVTNQDVAAIVQLNASTVSLENAFLVGNEFLTRNEMGGFLPSAEVVQYGRAHQWNKETAAHKLAPLLERTWFVRKLMPKLRLREMAEDEAIADLADAAQAGPNYKGQLQILLDYAEKSGLFLREGGIIKLAPKSPGDTSSQPENTRVPEKPADQRNHRDIAAIKSHHGDQGGISMQFTIHVSMAELSAWQPDRITAFFAGVSAMLAAKGKSGEEIG